MCCHRGLRAPLARFSSLLLSRPSAAAAATAASVTFPFRSHGLSSTRLKRFRAMASSGPKESPSNNPGLCSQPDAATSGYFMQQTMIRIKDPKVSLDFYSRVLGMKLLKRLDSAELKFSVYFLGYENLALASADPVQRTVWTFCQKGTLELTHNWGTESDPEFKGYHNGNSDPRGFGHIGITVDDTYKACERFESLGVEIVKKPDDVHLKGRSKSVAFSDIDYMLPLEDKPYFNGKMKGIAFIKDPDGYWIEIFDLKTFGDKDVYYYVQPCK